jgi:ribonuclease VapC
MVIDSSALVAILFDEGESEEFRVSIADGWPRLLSAASHVEASILMFARKGQPGLGALDALVARYKIEVVPVTKEQAMLARGAFISYGRGNHRARLNFGDCFSYALSKEENEPLLFKGEDFAKTDVLKA